MLRHLYVCDAFVRRDTRGSGPGWCSRSVRRHGDLWLEKSRLLGRVGIVASGRRQREWKARDALHYEFALDRIGGDVYSSEHATRYSRTERCANQPRILRIQAKSSLGWPDWISAELLS
jgi:hypothetical protein